MPLDPIRVKPLFHSVLDLPEAAGASRIARFPGQPSPATDLMTRPKPRPGQRQLERASDRALQCERDSQVHRFGKLARKQLDPEASQG